MSRDFLRRVGAPNSVLALALFVSVVVAFLVHTALEMRVEVRYQSAVERTSGIIQGRIQTYVALLRATAGLFDLDYEIGPGEFATFVQRLDFDTFYPGIQGIGFARRVGPEGLAELVAYLRDAGIADFAVYPDDPRPEYIPIVFLEPRDLRNRGAIGFDMYSEAVRREAMQRARDQGAPAASGRVRLVEEVGRLETPEQMGFLIYVPVYRGGVIPETVDERRRELVGFAYAPFRADDLFRAVLPPGESRLVDIAIFDGPEAGPEHLLHRSARPAYPLTGIQRYGAIEVAGRIWTLAFSPRPELFQASGRHLTPLVLFAGLGISLLIYFVMRLQHEAKVRAEAAAAALRASDNRFRLLLEQAPLAVQIFSPDGDTLLVNRAWEELWEVDRTEAGGYNLLADSALQPKGLRNELEKVFAGKRVRLGPIYYDPAEVSLPGRARWLEAHAYPVTAEDGTLREVVLLLEDVTDRLLAEEGRRKTEAQLRRAREELTRYAAELEARVAERTARLAEINLALESFTYSVSHDLRAPLRAMHGFANVILDGYEADLAPPVITALQRIVDAAERMDRLVDDLLTYSRLSRQEIFLGPVALEEAVDEAVAQQQSEIEARGARIEVVRPMPQVQAHAPSLVQGIANLLSNAIKFVPPDRVPRVHVSAEHRPKGRVRLSVTDNGIGIEPIYQERIFRIFERLKQLPAPGTGIGLASVQKAMERMGGSLGVESTPGVGSCFWLELELAEGAARDS